jgi:hypothetical protein
MRKKKSVFFPVSLFFIIAWFCGFIQLAAGETLNCKSESKIDVDHMDSLLLKPPKNFMYGDMKRVGSVSCDKEEPAKFFRCQTYVRTENGGMTQGITILTFKDSSKIVMRYSQSQRPDPEKKVNWIYDATGEIVNGNGRFEGIQGSVSISGKDLADIYRTEIQEMTITYTLPSK